MSSHSKAAAKFIADAPRTAWHDKALFAVRTKRDKMMHEVPEWEALREASSQIKRHTLSHLAHYLEEFERNATANGIVVHWAADADEMNRTVWELISAHGGKNLIKSKSMLSEECGLTPYLLQRGVDAVESDLGERIMQLLHEPPSHIVLPAIGVRREEVGELFEREFGTEHGNSDPTYLTHEARRQLRPKFLGADIAMTGVNFAVASTGTLAVCTNEGNADMGTSFPDLHIAIMGLEKVIPDMRALAVFTRLLARSGTGQPVTSYTSLYRKPAPGKRIHVVIVDNGRSEWLADAAHRNMLKCLRCGACMNTCPVYRRSGGYSYSYFIPGPLGIKSPYRPAGMYHTMLQRVVPYTIRGFFYYQGENDEIRPDTYGTLLTMLIARWRQDFEDARLPFILVQLPMHTYADTPENGAWSRLREAQMQVYQTVKHTGIAVILDCGEYCNIHPVDKHPVGHRLALQARQLAYGERELEAFGPIFRSFVVEGSTLTVFFSHAAQGMEWHGEPCGFQIAGADGVYHDARAVLDGDTVRLTAAEVPAPAAARYNWVNYGAVTLFGKNGIPAAPFRTEASPLPLTAVCE